MIKFADQHTEALVRSMWKICFEDTDAFIDLQFGHKYRHENTLIYFEKGEAVASLQMFPYSITFYGKIVPFYYLAGLCTLPQHRQKGYMAKLIELSHTLMKERNIPLAILIPAEEWLYGFYQKYDYEQVFETDDKEIPLKQILDTHPTLEDAYKAFDALFRPKDFCVQKTFDDFVAIVNEYRLDSCPAKYNLSGMARIIDPKALLDLYAQQNRQADFCIKLNSENQSASYLIRHGHAEIGTQANADIEVDSRLLCRLLFGYKTAQLPPPYPILFAEKQPLMNLMFE